MLCFWFFLAAILVLDLSSPGFGKTDVNQIEVKQDLLLGLRVADGASRTVSPMSSAAGDARREVIRVNLPEEIQSPYFILRPLCVAK